MMRTAILLSTYCPNATYLSEQLDSIGRQTVSCALVRRDDSETHLGAMKSFETLLQETDGYDYYAFADQDDVWKPQKMERLIGAMEEAERSYGKQTPLVVHCDLEVVDSGLKRIAASFWQYSGLNPDMLDHHLPYMAISNCVTGCAMLLNAAARKVSLPFGNQAYMHDQWIAVSTLRAGGQVIPVREALVLYRQHGKNTLGAVEYKGMSLQGWREKRKLFWTAYLAGKGICWNTLPAFVYWKIRHILARL